MHKHHINRHVGSPNDSQVLQIADEAISNERFEPDITCSYLSDF